MGLVVDSSVRVGLPSRHRLASGELVHVERRFHPGHAAAGYHLREWGEPAHAEHELLGDHAGVLVEYVVDVEAGAGGPEFRLTFPNGASVTALCADTVRELLAQNAGVAAA